MNRGKQFLSRWKTEYDFKTFAGASGQLAVTLLFACYNGYLGVSLSSLWYSAICMYYVILVLLLGTIIAAAKKLSRQGARETARNRVFLVASLLLLVLNLSLITPVSLMVRQQKPINMTLVPAIAMAAFTTYKVVVASVNLRKRRVSSDCLVWLLRTIGFIDALVSLLTLQNTLIMVNAGGQDLEMMPMTAATSALVCCAVLLLSVVAIAKALRQIRRTGGGASQ